MPAIAKVVVDLALDREFDYLIPAELAGGVRLGMRVVVPFGKRETRGYVVGLADRSERAELKAIAAVVGHKPLIEEGVLRLARWISDYYCAPIEHAVRAVLPGAVRHHRARFKEQSRVELVADWAARLAPEAMERLRARAPKQAAVVEALAREGGHLQSDLARRTGADAGALRTLEHKGIVRVVRETTARDPLFGQVVVPTTPLAPMPQQAAALEVVRQAMDTLSPPVVLLHGVTGSGKTEVYLQAIGYALEQGKGAVVLVPEIALTPQTIERFRGRFGDVIAVLHSHLSPGERHDEWHRLHDGQARIAIGARSAVFAPVRRLGLIVVDEEHEQTYKQEESPRYHARDVAVMRGHMERCAVLLGSATPSLESYWNARRGKYRRVALPQRVDDRRMPLMRIVDMRHEARETGRGTIFSRELMDAVRRRLDRAEQTMLFLNRRGFATSLVCPQCGFVAACDSCSIAYVYHRQSQNLRCHVCGAARHVPPRCPQCNDPAFRYAGVGTQRVEDAVKKLFPHARVQRMDSDTTTAKDSHRLILGDFRTGKIDILVGTQMIAKGLDFPNVTLIGVVNADLSLHMPDFRAGERTLQLLTQVAGRAGRGDVPGEVIVQTYTPMNPAVQAARRLDYEGFCDQDLEFRRALRYPPFAHLVVIGVRGPDAAQTQDATAALAARLREALSSDVTLSGPAPAPLARAKGLYRFQLLLRSPSVRRMVEPLRAALRAFRWPRGVACQVDVDAVSLM